jgi:hypothetical protein
LAHKTLSLIKEIMDKKYGINSYVGANEKYKTNSKLEKIVKEKTNNKIMVKKYNRYLDTLFNKISQDKFPIEMCILLNNDNDWENMFKDILRDVKNNIY